MDILLTNDDGIDAVGIRAAYDALSAVGDVTVVAPAEDQSAVGRALSREFQVEKRDVGYAAAGTPTDCVLAGVHALDLEPDLVVAGCNRGANIGEYVLGRSGTVSAAVEAAFLGIPAIATSLYIPVGDVAYTESEPERDAYADAVEAAAYLAEHAAGEGVFEDADYLNVNAPPAGDERAPMRVTRPSHVFDMDATYENGTVTVNDRIWDRMAEGDVPDPDGTDRRAVMDGEVSVSPLTAPHETEHHEALDALAETF